MSEVRWDIGANPESPNVLTQDRASGMGVAKVRCAATRPELRQSGGKEGVMWWECVGSGFRDMTDTLECMDADYKSIDALSQKLSTIKHTLRRWRTRLRNFLQPMAALPMEVLQRIFLYAVQPREYDYNFKYLPSPITLSEVSSTWRHAAQSYPPIWTVVQLEPCDHRSYAPYARYSGSLSLELHQWKQAYECPRIARLEDADVQGQITTLSLPLDRTMPGSVVISGKIRGSQTISPYESGYRVNRMVGDNPEMERRDRPKGGLSGQVSVLPSGGGSALADVGAVQRPLGLCT
ncbi:uncharacterized protein EI90DRAFT_3120283 [Cantharellus anzutake]|uniref:uncharacterized protein n=1 Tax=Cantharellus anzutake TaxID=1750568 RepID=UPI001903B2E5|nr:uncharacterized protein EI90DRAFT_3120283 [Cantharellus anzutake]KAF8335300.1 hypothetical protein EI90DRAFT_3120283 [Cantharellus anzutake]